MPVLFEAKLGDPTYWWPTMLWKEMRDGRLTPYFLLTGRQCSGKMELWWRFQVIFAHFTPIFLGGRASFWPFQAGFTGRPWSGICR